MTNSIEGYLSCTVCRKSYFRLEATPATMPGVFQNKPVALEDVEATGDGKTCPTEGCGDALVRTAENITPAQA